jgi:hypothetical protein
MSAVREALCLFLQGDTGAGKLMELATDVYPNGTAPEGATFPLVLVYAQQAPRGEFTFGGLDHEESRYVVKAVDESTSPARVSEMNRRIRARLDPEGRGEVELEVEGQGTVFCGWVQDVEYDEPDGDAAYQHEGAIYEVWTESE